MKYWERLIDAMCDPSDRNNTLIGFVFIIVAVVGISVSAVSAKSIEADVDCILIRYTGSSEEGLKISEMWLKEKGCKRSIVYPEGYVPVLIPQEEMASVRKLVGKDRFIRLSPNME